jgi:hypothetical protein
LQGEIPLERVYHPTILARMAAREIGQQGPPAADAGIDPRYEGHLCILLLLVVGAITSEQLVENLRSCDEGTHDAGPTPGEYETLFRFLAGLAHVDARAALTRARQAITCDLSRARLAARLAAGAITEATLDIEMVRTMMIADELRAATGRYL